MTGTEIWPFFGLRLETQRLVVRCATEQDVCTLAGVLPPDVETDPSLPSHPGFAQALQRSMGELQQYWRNLGAWTADAWKIPFVVEIEQRPLGIQTLEGEDFARRRVVDTASWLLADARSRGIGREMRAAVLHLAFEGLGARAAVTSAWHDNVASLGVSRSLGYVDNGYEVQVHAGRADRMQRMILTGDRWRDVDQPAVTIRGLEPCLPLFELE